MLGRALFCRYATYFRDGVSRMSACPCMSQNCLFWDKNINYKFFNTFLCFRKKLMNHAVTKLAQGVSLRTC